MSTFNKKTGHVTYDYQILPRRPEGKLKPDKFCRSCGETLPKRKHPVGIQFFYCQPNCAFDAAVHSAMKGYASPEYVKVHNEARAARRAEKSPLASEGSREDGSMTAPMPAYSQVSRDPSLTILPKS
jgi:hypothetical protein